MQPRTANVVRRWAYFLVGIAIGACIAKCHAAPVEDECKQRMRLAALAAKASAAGVPQIELWKTVTKIVARPDLTPRQQHLYRALIKTAYVRQKEGVPVNQIETLELLSCREEPIFNKE
jgi:hypothetical protein